LTACFARQTERSGGQKGRGLGGRNFCPPSLSATAEFRASEAGAPLKSFLSYQFFKTKATWI